MYANGTHIPVHVVIFVENSEMVGCRTSQILVDLTRNDPHSKVVVAIVVVIVVVVVVVLLEAGSCINTRSHM